MAVPCRGESGISGGTFGSNPAAGLREIEGAGPATDLEALDAAINRLCDGRATHPEGPL